MKGLFWLESTINFFWGNINLGNEDIIVVEGIEYMVKMEMKIIMKWKLCIFVYLNYWLSSKLFAYLSFGRKWYGKEVCEVLVNNEKFCYISWNLAAKFIFTYMYFIYMYKFYSQKTFFSPLNMLIKIVYVCVRMLSCVLLFVTPWAVVCQAALSMKFSRQEYWSGLPFPPPGTLPNPWIEHACLVSAGSSALQADCSPCTVITLIKIMWL